MYKWKITVFVGPKHQADNLGFQISFYIVKDDWRGLEEGIEDPLLCITASMMKDGKGEDSDF